MQRKPNVTYLKDYKVPQYLIDKVDLTFDLNEEKTVITSQLEIHTNLDSKETPKELTLHGHESIKLSSLLLDGKELNQDQFTLTEKNNLIIKNVPAEKFTLEIKTIINPKENTDLLGLYISNGNYVTQCEAEGFRHMTYFIDRPDVMSVYTTTIIADEKQFPNLLSNGNFIAKGKNKDGRHWVKWEDPFKKPSYLYALVAGNFDCLEDVYQTSSGRVISLQMYAEIGYGNRLQYAMNALQKAMHWDEVNYGRECDLDVYKVVGVSDFTAGAMENKGLNIFNAKYILASDQTATDRDCAEIDRTIGHEYFHNWTGNRITLREWFQLSLKEGLTTFREQTFSEDLHSVASRIDYVSVIRNRQFADDAGPLAHPVQPKEYEEIDNFYTRTVYRKGAEIYRMLQVILGKKTFRKGMDLYFERHDGQAVTIENLIKAHEDASKMDLSHFSLWFHQAGTPVVDVEDKYNPTTETYTLKFKQTCPATPGQPDKKPLVIPIKMGLLSQNGKEQILHLEGSDTTPREQVLVLDKSEQEFKFTNVASKPIPSLFRGFSAPVKCNYSHNDQELNVLSTHDSDLFNRWDANRRYFTNHMVQLIKNYQENKKLVISRDFIDNFKKMLTNHYDDLEMLALMLQLPSATELAQQQKVIDIDAIETVRQFMVTDLAKECEFLLIQLYTSHRVKNSSGDRSVKNTCLSYLMNLNSAPICKITVDQFNKSLNSNMTDTIGAMQSLINIRCKERDEVLSKFYTQWKNDPHVINHWFELQAASSSPDTLDNVKALVKHEAFDIKNPNKVYSLIKMFARNLTCFHEASGEGYQFLASFILDYDRINANIASDLATCFSDWNNFDSRRQKLMLNQLQRILLHPGISSKVHEVVSKSLEGATLKDEPKKIEERLDQPCDEKMVSKRVEGTSVKEKPKKLEDLLDKLSDSTSAGSCPSKKQVIYSATALGATALTVYGIYRYLKQPEKITDVVVQQIKKSL